MTISPPISISPVSVCEAAIIRRVRCAAAAGVHSEKLPFCMSSGVYTAASTVRLFSHAVQRRTSYLLARRSARRQDPAAAHEFFPRVKISLQTSVILPRVADLQFRTDKDRRCSGVVGTRGQRAGEPALCWLGARRRRVELRLQFGAQAGEQRVGGLICIARRSGRRVSWEGAVFLPDIVATLSPRSAECSLTVTNTGSRLAAPEGSAVAGEVGELSGMARSMASSRLNVVVSLPQTKLRHEETFCSVDRHVGGRLARTGSTERFNCRGGITRSLR